MVEPNLDQPLADGERHEPLRRLARDAELARDLVLGVAGDVIEPAGARGLVEPQSVVIRPSRHAVPYPNPRAGCEFLAKYLRLEKPQLDTIRRSRIPR